LVKCGYGCIHRLAARSDRLGAYVIYFKDDNGMIDTTKGVGRSGDEVVPPMSSSSVMKIAILPANGPS